MLRDILPAAQRKAVYALYVVIGVLIGALQVGYTAVPGADQPTWLTVALAVYAYVGVAVGATAASNTTSYPSQSDPAPGQD